MCAHDKALLTNAETISARTPSQEAICGGFVDCAGAPRMGETLAWGPGSRSRSGTIAMIPTGDETDTAKEEPPFVKIKNKPAAVKESEILGVSSPDPQGLPTRTVTWAGQESFSWKESDEPSRFFPDDRDACSDSSSACAENEQDGNGGNESSESESVSTELDQSEIKINAADGFGEAIKYDERTTSEEIVAVVDGKSLALENSTDTLQQVSFVPNSHYFYVLPAVGFRASDGFCFSRLTSRYLFKRFVSAMLRKSGPN